MKGRDVAVKHFLNTLPSADLLMRLQVVDSVLQPDSIGISITDKPNVRAEIWALLFDAEDNPYTDEQRIINIFASEILNNGLELMGMEDKGAALFPEGTSEAVLRKAYRYFGQTYIPVAVPFLFQDGTAYTFQDGTVYDFQ